MDEGTQTTARAAIVCVSLCSVGVRVVYILYMSICVYIYIDIVKRYREIMSKEMYKKFIKYYHVEELLVKGKSFILERNFLAVAKASKTATKMVFHMNFYYHVRNKIGPVYQKALKNLDNKRDKDLITALLGKITNIRFSSTLENKESCSGLRNAFHWLEKDLPKYEQIKKTSLTVRSDMK